MSTLATRLSALRLVFRVFFDAGIGGVTSPFIYASPISNPLILDSTATPASRIESRNFSIGIGSSRDPAMTPSTIAFRTVPSFSASVDMSNRTARLASFCAALSSLSERNNPSPIADFSTTEYTRWVEAISVVRSGVTMPFSNMRPASISSDVTTISMLPGAGYKPITNSCPFSASNGAGKIST